MVSPYVGCKIYSTEEIVIQAIDKYEFTREKDGTTPWEELQVNELSAGQAEK